ILLEGQLGFWARFGEIEELIVEHCLYPRGHQRGEALLIVRTSETIDRSSKNRLILQVLPITQLFPGSSIGVRSISDANDDARSTLRLRDHQFFSVAKTELLDR